MDERHTGENSAESLKIITQEWKIAEKVRCIVRDNATNMVKACRLLQDQFGWDHEGCVGHTLQLLVTAGLESATISNLLAKARKLVGHFSHSLRATAELHKVQKRNKRLKRNLFQDVSTRWNSSYLMLGRLVQEKLSVSTVLEDEATTSAQDRDRLRLSGEQWFGGRTGSGA